jgi:hypothetical protein
VTAPVVFLGPSLARSEATQLCPRAEVRPPARKGDVLAAVVDDGATVIGLVDGEFDQSLSVWHKELLFALESGVAVLGASSMGALRAAELADWGMRGVGEVFRAYASGELIDDDEVALVFASDDGEYRKISEPMVNIRASLRAAVAAGVATQELAGLALDTAKRLHYPDRSYRRVMQLLRGLGVAGVDELATFLDRYARDVKADDARELLGILAKGDPPPAAPARLNPTVAFDTLFRRERPLGGADGPTADDLAARVAAVPGGGDLREAALNRGFLLMIARMLRLRPDPDQIDAELTRWRAERSLADEDQLADWLRRNHTSRAELRLLARDAVLCHWLRRWLATSLSTEGEAPLLVDHLRWSGRLEPWLAS